MAPPQLFRDIEPILLHYKNANDPTRKSMVLDAIAGVKKLSGKVTSKAAAKKHYKVLCYATTLMNYADVLQRIEHQQFFDILIDFYKMDLNADLHDWFEFGSPVQMKLKKPISEYTPEIWEKFRTAQKAHLKKTNKELIFDLDQLDIHHPPVKQLYPIQIQMLGKLFNEAVDRISINTQGQIRFVKHFGHYLLPGGGMLEINTPSRIELKMLKEHLEEEHANLHVKAKVLYNALNKNQFNTQLFNVLESKQTQLLPHSFLEELKTIARGKGTNGDRLHKIVLAIDAQREIIREDQAKKTLVELRAQVQVQTFALTPLFAESFEYIKVNTKQVDIQQYIDTRAAGGVQMSHTFIMTQPLEDWFKEKFHGVEGEFGDDISGSEVERLTLLQAIALFRKIRFSHLLIGLAAYNEALDNHTLQIEHVWSDEQFNAALQSICP